jgi:phosphoglycolate phosphatase-like HAD superfamily hydrolase
VFPHEPSILSRLFGKTPDNRSEEQEMIKHILWDFEGTLFDTSPARTYAMSRTMAELGFSIPLNIIDGLIRQSYDRCIESLGKRYPFSVQEARDKFQGYYAAIPCKNQILYPGVTEVCSWIARKGGSNWIITDREPDDCRRFLCDHVADRYFDGIWTRPSGDKDAIAKALITLLNQNQLVAETVLAVANQEQIIRAAHQAGLKTCRYGTDQRATVADWQAGHYAQLLSFLRQSSQIIDGGKK